MFHLMKKRYIVVPKTVEVANRLDKNLVSPNELIEITLSDEDFNDLEKSGFFYYLNNLVSVNIDDYEDELIEGEDNIKKVINSISTFNGNSRQKSLLEEIKRLFKEALLRNTAVYFYF